MSEDRLEVELCLLGAGAVTALSLGLMVWATVTGSGPLSGWALLAGLAAALWWVQIIVGRASRRVVRAVAREIAFATRHQEDEGLHAVH